MNNNIYRVGDIIQFKGGWIGRWEIMEKRDNGDIRVELKNNTINDLTYSHWVSNEDVKSGVELIVLEKLYCI